MSERIETERCIKALYKYSSFPFFIIGANHWVLISNMSLLKPNHTVKEDIKCIFVLWISVLEQLALRFALYHYNIYKLTFI